MAWETIEPGVGARVGNGGIAVGWRCTSKRSQPVLSITLSADLCGQIGLAKGARVRVQRDRLAGKMRLSPDPAEGWKPQWRSWASNRTACACIYVPLEDVTLKDRKAAQTVPWEMDGSSVVMKLPAWACPPVKVLEMPARRSA